MATQLKLRRGTTTQHSTFTGPSGEVTVDTTKTTAVVHDGATAGGVPLLTEGKAQTVTNKTIALADNTVSGTLAQFNAACSDADFATAGANSNITSLSGLTTALSFSQGGTSATTRAAAVEALGIDKAEISIATAANATTNIGAAAGSNILLTTTATTITGFATATAGVVRKIRFSTGGVTLTHGSGFVLPGAADIVSAANDTCEAYSTGSGWLIRNYQKANGQAVVAPAAGVSSVNGNTGAITAAQIAAAATAGYGYTPANGASMLTKDMGHNNVGSLCFAGRTVQNGTTITTGGTVAGSSLIAVGIGIAGTGGYNETSTMYVGSGMSGTWRCLGAMPRDDGWASQITLFQRIS